MSAPRRTPRARRRGFTLLEVLVALAIFSIGLLALVPLFAMASRGGRGSRDLTRATALARTYVDKLRNTPYTSLGIDPTTNAPCAGACTPPAAEVAANAPAVVSWTVTRVDGGAYDFANPPTPRIKRVTVTATMPCSDCAGGQRRVWMTTLISERS